MDQPKRFETSDFRDAFVELLAWRRDVRRFRPDPLPGPLLDSLIASARLAPSVGLSEPWRFARVRDPGRRAAVRANFERCNAQALAGYEGADARLYATLKLQGLSEAPEQLAVFCDAETGKGRGLGRLTMPQALDHSVVTAVHTLWLAARTHGVGVGWVSILEPKALGADLGVPAHWRLIAYLCLGLPEQESLMPELQRLGWEARDADATPILQL